MRAGEDVGLDYETFSDVDIKTHGANRYFESPQFQTLCAGVAGAGWSEDFDLVRDPDRLEDLDRRLRDADSISCHNASFERRVTKELGLSIPDHKFRDSAVTARAWGAGSRLEAAAPQLLGMNKLDLGADLIRVFCVPTKDNGGKPYTWAQILADVELRKKWDQFLEYCRLDAKLSHDINTNYGAFFSGREKQFELITEEMNQAGWFVDMPLVHEMQRRYEVNLAGLEGQFRAAHAGAGTLNFRSHPQLQRWCADRGVRAKSFDQQSVPKLIRQVQKKLDTTPATDPKWAGYVEVLDLLKLKQEMGGSSLSKLQTIIDMTSKDNRLRGQYLHVGAGQSFRTSGRGVQLQNLARLGQELGDLDEVYIGGPHWDNGKLAENIRQVFMAEHPDGQLIVGDFSSVESRGLAYLAGEAWKLDAYAAGKDIYKQLATTYQSFGGVAYEDVTKQQRQAGKVGELACGYGAGAGAVQGFAEKMGIDMDEAESAAIVRDWRAADPAITGLWKKLDQMLHGAMASPTTQIYELPNGGEITLARIETPASLKAQHPGAQSIGLTVWTQHDLRWMTRVFHGCYYRGNDLCFYKPSELKGGDLWRSRMTTPPHAWYKLYGGKLAGILTQSFCRELFFQSLHQLNQQMQGVENVKLIGQFHDEIVVEWSPAAGMKADTVSSVWSLEDTLTEMERAMTNAQHWDRFPLAADIKHAHRYIK